MLIMNIKGGMWIQFGRPRQRCTMNVMEVAEMEPLRRRRTDHGWMLRGGMVIVNSMVVVGGGGRLLVAASWGCCWWEIDGD